MKYLIKNVMIWIVSWIFRVLQCRESLSAGPRLSFEVRYDGLKNQKHIHTKHRMWSGSFFVSHLKERFGIAPENFESHENSASFNFGYLSEFLLKWYVRHGVGKLRIHTFQKSPKISLVIQSPLISAMIEDECNFWTLQKLTASNTPHLNCKWGWMSLKFCFL